MKKEDIILRLQEILLKAQKEFDEEQNDNFKYIAKSAAFSSLIKYLITDLKK